MSLNYIDDWFHDESRHQLIHALVEAVCVRRHVINNAVINLFCETFRSTYLCLGDFYNIVTTASDILGENLVDAAILDARWRDAHTGFSDEPRFIEESSDPDVRLAFEVMIEAGAIRQAYRFIRHN